MTGIACDLLERANLLRIARVPWDEEWSELATFFLPSQARGFQNAQARNLPGLMDTVTLGPPSRDKSVVRRRYDSTAMWALDRLSSGVESLVTPQSEKWHGLAIDMPLAPIPTIPERQWLERTRDYIFDRRYDARSGFAVANAKAMRSAIAFGTGVSYVEEAFGKPGQGVASMPMTYRACPLYECYMDVSAQGMVDTNYRRSLWTARQLVQRFGDKVSKKVRLAADDVKMKDRRFELIHCVEPRKEAGSYGGGMRKAAFASYYIEAEHEHLIGEGGFHEFPFVVYHWSAGDDGPYGESPAMLALDDVRGLNAMRKAGLRAMQQWVSPPIAAGAEGSMSRPNLNPNAINYGAVDNNGNLKIRPILTAQSPAGIERIMEAERNGIKEVMYINLFQALIQNPSMTATEAMLRANEKGELLGPSGTKMQMGLAQMVEREVAILARKDAFAPGALLAAPPSVQGRSISVRFTSPLDRLRRSAEAQGIQRTYEAAGMIANAKQDPSVFDKLDDDVNLTILAEVNGAPAMGMRSDEQVAKIRGDRAAAMAQAQKMQQMQAMAESAGKAAPALQQLPQLQQMAGNQVPVDDGSGLQNPLGPLAGAMGGQGAPAQGAPQGAPSQ
jgi:hypothetical protein